MTFSPVRKSGKRNIFMTTAITQWAQGMLFAILKNIDLTDCRIELYRLVYMCGLLSEEKENGFRGVRC